MDLKKQTKKENHEGTASLCERLLKCVTLGATIMQLRQSATTGNDDDNEKEDAEKDHTSREVGRPAKSGETWQLMMKSVAEARIRAALLLIHTWDPVTRTFTEFVTTRPLAPPLSQPLLPPTAAVIPTSSSTATTLLQQQQQRKEEEKVKCQEAPPAPEVTPSPTEEKKNAAEGLVSLPVSSSLSAVLSQVFYFL